MSAIRTALLFGLVLFAGAAQAQTPQVTGATVAEFGVYSHEVLKRETAPGPAEGSKEIATDIKLVTQTRTIPGHTGVTFGFRLVVTGEPANAVVPLHIVVVFPSPMTNPATGQPLTKAETDRKRRSEFPCFRVSTWRTPGRFWRAPGAIRSGIRAGSSPSSSSMCKNPKRARRLRVA